MGGFWTQDRLREFGDHPYLVGKAEPLEFRLERSAEQSGFPAARLVEQGKCMSQTQDDVFLFAPQAFDVQCAFVEERKILGDLVFQIEDLVEASAHLSLQL